MSVSKHQKSLNPFASYQYISTIEFFSPYGVHVKTCPDDERPMLTRITFKESLRHVVSYPEGVMNNCGEAMTLVLLTTGFPLMAIPTEFIVDEEKLTLTYYQHEEPKDRPLHYNVLIGHFLVLFKELHSYWQISEDTAVPEHEDSHPLFRSKNLVT
jgi:hypothetical protein